MLQILQTRLQQNMNREPLDVQSGFRKGRGTRAQISNICWIIEKAREFQKKYLLPRNKSFNFMAAISISSDFGGQKIKSDTVSIVSLSISHEVMGPDAMILVF